MKKIVFAAAVALLCGCSQSETATQAAFPGEFANMDYELSDKDAQRWVAASKQAEACIYPNLTRIQQSHFSKEDSFVHAQYVFFYPLEEIIGDEYVKIIQNDEKSMGYAQYQFKKFKTTEADKALSRAACETLRAKARDDLAVVKGQYRSGMIEESSTESKDSKGAATDQNKFFFDIIKWGTALLL